VDEPPSPQTKRTTPDSLKPSSPKGARDSPGADGAPNSLTHAAPGKDPVGASLVPKPNESPSASPPSPRSHGLGAAGGSQRSEGSSAPQPEEIP
jgi:hypothetical protein